MYGVNARLTSDSLDFVWWSTRYLNRVRINKESYFCSVEPVRRLRVFSAFNFVLSDISDDICEANCTSVGTTKTLV